MSKNITNRELIELLEKEQLDNEVMIDYGGTMMPLKVDDFHNIFEFVKPKGKKVRKKSLWNDTFKIVFTLPNEEEVVEQFDGSLRSAVNYALNKHTRAVASFYTSDNDWLKEICWRET